MSQAEALLQQIKLICVKYAAAYDMLTDLRQDIARLAQNFDLSSVPLPENAVVTGAAPATAGDNAIKCEVAIWLNQSGTGKAVATGKIDGMDQFRLLFFNSDKEGIVLSGAVVHADAPEGSDFNDIKCGYLTVRQQPDGSHQLAIKFDQLDFWMQGTMARNVSDNPKAPNYKAQLVPSESRNANSAFSSLFAKVELAPPAPAPEVVAPPLEAVVPFPLEQPQAAPTIADQLPIAVKPVAPVPTVAPSLFAAAPTPATLPDVNPPSLFAKPVPDSKVKGIGALTANTELPKLGLPTWMTDD